MGSLDRGTGSQIKRQIKLVDVTRMSLSSIESAYNSKYGPEGYQFLQIATVGSVTYMVLSIERS